MKKWHSLFWKHIPTGYVLQVAPNGYCYEHNEVGSFKRVLDLSDDKVTWQEFFASRHSIYEELDNSLLVSKF